jgi:hypothetical protein
LFHLSFGKTDVFVYMDGHPQATVVLIPCSLLKQGFKEATIGITSCASSLFVYLFIGCLSCSTECSKRGECCIYGLQLSWCIISLRWWSFQTQLEMPAECACIRTGHTLNAVYKITNVPVLENTRLLSISSSTVLSRHPSPVQSPWFPLPIGWLHLQRSLPRSRLIESASGLYKHLWWLLSATRRYPNTFQVSNCGQWLITGFPIFTTLNKHWKCWLYHEEWCNAVAEVRRVCRRFWRLNVGWAETQIYMWDWRGFFDPATSSLVQFSLETIWLQPSKHLDSMTQHLHSSQWQLNHALQLYVTHLYLP